MSNVSVSATSNKEYQYPGPILTNACAMVSSVQVVDGILGSDHIAVDFIIEGKIVDFIIEGKIKRVSTRKRTIYNFNKADRDLYDDLLSKVQRDSCFRFSSIDEIWCNFNVTVFEIADLCNPKISMKNKYRGWLSPDTMLLIRRKSAFTKYKCSKKP